MTPCVRTFRGVRSFRRNVSPVALGQCSLGFTAAAVLVAWWLVAQPLEAQAAPITGATGDDYIRVEWMWDLSAGFGQISLIPQNTDGEVGDWVLGYLRSMRFVTADVQPTGFGGNLGDYVNGPDLVAVVGGQHCYRYTVNSAPAMASLAPRSTLDIHFPTEQVALFDTEIQVDSIQGFVSSSVIPILPVSSSFDFVSIQQIPEPASAMTLAAGLGAAAMAYGRRREEDDASPDRA